MYSNLGESIKYFRKNSGLTLTELGKKLEVSHAYLSKVENNKVSPSLKVISDMAKIFEKDTHQDVATLFGLISENYEIVDVNSSMYKSLKDKGYIWEEKDGFEYLKRPYLDLEWLLSQKEAEVKYNMTIDFDGNDLVTTNYVLRKKDKKAILSYIESLTPFMDFETDSKED